MNYSSDAADEIVKMYLEGVKVVAKISGEGAKNIAVMLYAIQKDQKQTKGKTKLKNMLKSNSKLKVFSIRQQDLKKFSKEAKRNGVLFCVLTSKFGKKDPNKMIDIMVREEDAARINRIVDKFKLSTYDKAYVKKELEHSKEKNNNEKEQGVKESNPILARTEKSPLSEHSLENNKSLEGSKSENKKSSVKKELEDIKEEQLSQSEIDKQNPRANNKITKYKQPKKKIKKKHQER